MAKRTREMSLSDEAGSSSDMTVLQYILSKTGDDFYGTLDQRIPPGFMEFLKRTNKTYVKENIGTIIGLHGFPEQEESYQSWQRYLAAARIVYNQSTTKYKNNLEANARETKMNMMEPPEAEGAVEPDPSLGADESNGVPNESSIIEMRQTEYGICDDIELEEMIKKLASGKTICPKKIEAEEACMEEFETLDQFVDHLDIVHPVCCLFACGECDTAFPSKQLHRQHECTQKVVKSMSFCRFIIVCTCCGRHFSVNLCTNNDRKTMNNLRYFMIGHNSYNIRLIKLYSAGKILDGASLKINFLPSYIRQMSSYCSTCGVNISNLADLRAHSHSFKQLCCETTWTTQLDYIKHVTDKHFPAALLVDYLSQSDFRSLNDGGTGHSSTFLNPVKTRKMPISTTQVMDLLKLQRSDDEESDRGFQRLKVYGSNAEGLDFHKFMKKGYVMKKVNQVFDRSSRNDIADNFMEDVCIKIQPLGDEIPNMNYKRRTIMCNQCAYTTDNDALMDTHLAACRKDIPEDERTTSNEDCVYIVLDNNSVPNAVFKCPFDQCDTDNCSMGGLQIHILQKHGKYAESNIINECATEHVNDQEEFTKRVNLACYLTAEGRIPDTGMHINELAEKAFDPDVFEFIKQIPKRAQQSSEASTSSKGTEKTKEIPPLQISSDTRPPKNKRRRVTIDEELEEDVAGCSNIGAPIIREAQESDETTVRSGAPNTCAASVINGAPKNTGAKQNHRKSSTANSSQPNSEGSIMGEATVITRATLEQLEQQSEAEEAIQLSEEPTEDVSKAKQQNTGTIEIGSLDALKMFNKTCPYCGLHYTKEKYLKKHIALHAELSLDCKVCKKEFANFCDLYLHQTKDHTKEPPTDRNVDNTDKVLCAVCSMSHFKSTVFSHQIYDCHKATHCGICAEDFAKQKRATAVQHLKTVHRNEYERFTCGCKKTFFHFLLYKIHECERNSAGGRCVYCRAAFKTAKEAAVHVMEDHARFVRQVTNRMQCQACMRTVDKNSMLNHSTTHVTNLGRERRLDSIRMEQNMFAKLNIERHDCQELDELVKINGEQSNERVIQQGFVFNNTTVTTSDRTEMEGQMETMSVSNKETNATQKKIKTTEKERNETSPTQTTKRKMPIYEKDPERVVSTVREEIGPEINETSQEEIEGNQTINCGVANASALHAAISANTHNVNEPAETTQEPMEQDIAQEDSTVNDIAESEINELNIIPPVVNMESIFGVESSGEVSDDAAEDIRPLQSDASEQPHVVIMPPTAEKTPGEDEDNALIEITQDEISRKADLFAALFLNPEIELQSPPSVQIIEPSWEAETTQTVSADQDILKMKHEDHHEDVAGPSGIAREPPRGEIPDEEDDDVQIVMQKINNATELAKPSPLCAHMPQVVNRPVLTFRPQADDEGIEMAEETTVGKMLKCDLCSASFAFPSALKKHKDTDHRFDNQEESCDKYYGLPKTGVFFLCRLESWAFEDKEKFQRHMATHKHHQKSLECALCTGIALQDSSAIAHMAEHNQGMTYKCTKCTPVIEFNQEHYLFEHLRAAHNAAMVYFCKACGMASLEIQLLILHMMSKACGPSKNTNLLDVKYLGLHPATIVQYIPQDQADQENKLQMNPENYLKMTDCSHHSFVRGSGALTTCPETADCFGLISYFRYKNLMEAQYNNGELLDDLNAHVPFIRDFTCPDPYNTIRNLSTEIMNQLPQSINPNNINVTPELSLSSCALKGAAPRPFDPRARPAQQPGTSNQNTPQPPIQNTNRTTGVVNQVNQQQPPMQVTPRPPTAAANHPQQQNMNRPPAVVNQTHMTSSSMQHSTPGTVNQANQQKPPMQTTPRPLVGVPKLPSIIRSTELPNQEVHQQTPMQNMARLAGVVNQSGQQAVTQNMMRSPGTMNATQQNTTRTPGAVNQLKQNPPQLQTTPRPPTGSANQPIQQQNMMRQANQQQPPMQNMARVAGVVNASPQVASTSSDAMHSPQPNQHMGSAHIFKNPTQLEMILMQSEQHYAATMNRMNQPIPAGQNISHEQMQQMMSGVQLSPIQRIGMMDPRQAMMNNGPPIPQQFAMNNQQIQNYMNQNRQMATSMNQHVGPTNRQIPAVFNQMMSAQSPNTVLQQMATTSNQQLSPAQEFRCALCLATNDLPKSVRINLPEGTKLILRTYGSCPQLTHLINDFPSYSTSLIHQHQDGHFLLMCVEHFRGNPTVVARCTINSSIVPSNMPCIEQIIASVQCYKNAHAVQITPAVVSWNAKTCYFCDISMNEKSLVTFDPSDQQQVFNWHATRKHIVQSAVVTVANLVKLANELPMTLNAQIHFCLRHVNPQSISVDDTGHLRLVNPNVRTIYCDYSKVVAALVPDQMAMNQRQNKMLEIMVNNPAMHQTHRVQLQGLMGELRNTNRCKSELCKNALLLEVPYVRLYHEMHLSQNLLVCVECMVKVKDEDSLIDHMVAVHRVNANQVMQFHLRCPLVAECGETTAFDKFLNLRAHMNTVHTNKLSHHSNICRAQFHTEQAAKQHDFEHGDVEFPCCYLCGLVGDWSTEQKTRHWLSHCIIKGPVACQICCQQFQSEVELFHHFREHHVRKLNDGEECACKARGKSITSVHIQERHKLACGSLPDNYVVELSPTFQYWLGLP